MLMIPCAVRLADGEYRSGDPFHVKVDGTVVTMKGGVPVFSGEGDAARFSLVGDDHRLYETYRCWNSRDACRAEAARDAARRVEQAQRELAAAQAAQRRLLEAERHQVGKTMTGAHAGNGHPATGHREGPTAGERSVFGLLEAAAGLIREHIEASVAGSIAPPATPEGRHGLLLQRLHRALGWPPYAGPLPASVGDL